MTNKPWRWVGLLAAAGASMSIIITALGGRFPGDAQEAALWCLLIGWTGWPYLFTWIACRLAAPSAWRRAAACGLFVYACVDVGSRWSALNAPDGSTDGIVLLFLPVSSPVIIGGVAGVVLLVSWLAGQARRVTSDQGTDAC